MITEAGITCAWLAGHHALVRPGGLNYQASRKRPGGRLSRLGRRSQKALLGTASSTILASAAANVFLAGRLLCAQAAASSADFMTAFAE